MLFANVSAQEKETLLEELKQASDSQLATNMIAPRTSRTCCLRNSSKPLILNGIGG